MTDLKISQFTDGGTIQETDILAAVRGGVNTKVTVGSAASLDVGTGGTDLPDNDGVDSKISSALAAYVPPALADGAYGVITIASENWEFTNGDYGDIVISGTNLLTIDTDAVTTTKILNANVTNAKLADMATKTYKGRTAGTTGAPEDVTVAQMQSDLDIFLNTGKTNGTAVAAGEVGQVLRDIRLIGSAITLTSGVTVNVATLNLPAGQWLVFGAVLFSTSPAGNMTDYTCEISTVSATLETVIDPSVRTSILSGATAGARQRSTFSGLKEYNISSATNLYLVANAVLSSSVVAVYGNITAIRIG